MSKADRTALLKIINKNAFQYDAYRPLQWPFFLGGGALPGREGVVDPEGEWCLPEGVHPPQ